MTVAADRLPRWTLAAPILALATDLVLHGSATAAAGLALGVALLAAVLAAVHHAEVVAVRVGDPFGAVILALGSAVSSIGLTVPTVAAIAWWTGTPLELGVSAGGGVLLALSFLMALITYGTGRASLLSGVVHLILLATWLFLIIAP